MLRDWSKGKKLLFCNKLPLEYLLKKKNMTLKKKIFKKENYEKKEFLPL